MPKIIITVPEAMPTEEIADYVVFVSQQIRETYLGGHVTVDHHWTSEGRLS